MRRASPHTRVRCPPLPPFTLPLPRSPLPALAGLPRYTWLTEANSCINGPCISGKCPTTFVGPTGMAASFNRTSWYLKGYATGPAIRQALQSITDLDHMDGLLAELLASVDPTMTLDPASLRVPRSHRNGPKPVVLPEGWLDDPEDATPPEAAAEALVSGG